MCTDDLVPVGAGGATDQRGSIVIVTLFAASFMIGMLFGMHGIGHAIQHGDGKRDAADAVAYSGASIYAHAMNQVALLNMCKLTVLSVYSTAIAAESFGLEAINAYLALNILDPAYWPQIPIAVEFGVENAVWLAENGPRLQQVLRGLDQTQMTLQQDTYRLANSRMLLLAPTFLNVRTGFLAPERRLPLKAAPPDVPCLRLPMVPVQLFQAFERFQSDVGAIGLAAALAGILPTCSALAAESGSTKEITGRLGDEGFALRGYSIGPELRRHEEDGVRVATWRANEGGGIVTTLRTTLSSVGLAQSEFYFDGLGPQTGVASELMFSMKWRARMRRYRDIDGFGQFSIACERAGGGGTCATASVALAEGRSLIIH